MAETYSLPEWLWVVIEEENGVEKLLGQHDVEAGVSFIPAFNSQEDGQIALAFLQKVPGRKYEVQAMRASEVVRTAEPYDYLLYILDAKGTVLERLAPA